MILFLFPVTTSCSSKARATLWTYSFILSHSLTSLQLWLQRCFPSSEAWSLLPVKHALCYLFACGHTFLNWSRKTSTLAQGKQLLKQGQMGLAWPGASKVCGGPVWGDSVSSSHAHPYSGIQPWTPGNLPPSLLA